jgi:hypothetical protein
VCQGKHLERVWRAALLNLRVSVMRHLSSSLPY